jgi:hypothetical protein
VAEERVIFIRRGVRPPDGSELTSDARIGGKLVGVRGCVPAGGETRTGEAGPEYCQTRRELDLPGGRKGLYGRWFPDTRDRVLTFRISL